MVGKVLAGKGHHLPDIKGEGPRHNQEGGAHSSQRTRGARCEEMTPDLTIRNEMR